MPERAQELLDRLSPRENDCLRLLESGMHTPQVASSLGISVSTVNKHLASARRKLGVSRTAHALLLRQRRSETAIAPETAAVDAMGGDAALLFDFAESLERCRTFDEAWAVLEAYVGQIGVAHVNFGLVAEPAGHLTNGARVIRFGLPDELNRLYEETGGVRVDPTVPFVANNKGSFFRDNEKLRAAMLHSLPNVARMLVGALIDNRARFDLVHTERDPMTGSPVALIFVLQNQTERTARSEAAHLAALLGPMGMLFRAFLQRKQMLAGFAGLTNRQREG